MSKKEASVVKNPAKHAVNVPSYEEAGFTAIANHLDCKRRNAIAAKTKQKSDTMSRPPDAKQLQELGFDWLSQKSDICRRLAIAYEHYNRISEDSWAHVHAYSDITSIAKWAGGVPPSYVLAALKQAKERKCFERFDIFSLHHDPLLMGFVSDVFSWHIPFVVAHWGDDIDPTWLEKNTD